MTTKPAFLLMEPDIYEMRYRPMVFFTDVTTAYKLSKDITVTRGDLIDFKVHEWDISPLDPGGMFFQAIKPIPFEVNNFAFEVQPHKADIVLALMNIGENKRLPGYTRFKIYNWVYIMPDDMFEEVKAKVKAISESDAADKAFDEEEAVRIKLREHPNFADDKKLKDLGMKPKDN